MATSDEIQAQLGGINVARIIHSRNQDATYDAHYVVGGIGYNGKSPGAEPRWQIRRQTRQVRY